MKSPTIPCEGTKDKQCCSASQLEAVVLKCMPCFQANYVHQQLTLATPFV